MSKLALRQKSRSLGAATPPHRQNVMLESGEREIVEKKSLSELTIGRAALISPSRWKRGSASRKTEGAGSRIFWDCKLELNFVPAMVARKREITVGAEVEFFVARKMRSTVGSLKSTYRVVNTTF